MSKTNQIPVYKDENTVLKSNLATMIPAELLNVFTSDAAQLGVTYSNPLKVAVGDKASLFSLTNAINKTVSLEELLKNGPVVITFYRGNWCPYCNLILNAYQRILPQIKELGANLIAISPQNPDSSLSMKEKQELQFEVLSDKGNEAAKHYTTIIKNSIEAIDSASKLGVDFYAHYDDQSRDIPIPAVFIINKEGIITFAKSEGGDYSLRIEPKEILDALKTLSA
ncbi:peroxiredoxin-like family protein [Flavobacterium sp. UBA7682]|uniref:peroxiredoxin-like family protein n=1 Tax=Flavobacterium sp. UBA7682 TaxID=1946560 RepID=UPI0025C1E97A|nr:peroxiredoxin-like family protein [Flavobacterium sp. UBA7682]